PFYSVTPQINSDGLNAHVGHKGSEAADALAKQAKSVGSPLQYPAPRSFLKNIIKDSSLRCCQEEWDKGLTGRNIHRIQPKVSFIAAPWNRKDKIFAIGHGPFPSYFKRFHIKESDSCGCGEVEDPLYYASSCTFTTSFHL
ncbi:hypothetical protein AVEN_168700-1, partial [Araneus ventricosus]